MQQANENSEKIDVPTYLLTKGKGGKVPMTPANIKRKQALEGKVINSPTDSFFSPCSKLLTRNDKKKEKNIKPLPKPDTLGQEDPSN